MARISHNDKAARGKNVFLDGILQKNVRWFDIERGEIEKVKIDRNGNIVLNADKSAVELEIVRGVVTVI
jgi:hypothetical protein